MAQPRSVTQQEVVAGLQQLEQTAKASGKSGQDSVLGITARLFPAGRFSAEGASDFDVRFLQKLKERNHGKEGLEWLDHLLGVLIETRSRAQTAISRVTKESGTVRVDFTLNDLGDEKTAGVRLLQERILPFVERTKNDPQFLVKMANGLNVSDLRQVGSLFTNFSAEGRALPAPLHFVGAGLLQIKPKLAQWAETLDFPTPEARRKWLVERCTHLEESVKATYASEKMKENAAWFLNAYKEAHQYQDLSKQNQLNLWLDRAFRENRETVSHLVKLVLKLRKWGPQEQQLVELLVEKYDLLLDEAGLEALPQDLCVVLEGLALRLQRLNKNKTVKALEKSKNRPAPAPQAAPVMEDIKPLAGDQAQAAAHLANWMRQTRAPKIGEQPAQNPFVQLLKSSIQKHGHHLCIDPQKSTFEVIGAGGTCVVVKVFDSLLNKEIAIRCDILGLTDERDAQLAIRNFGIHSKLNHPNIVKHLGFDSVPMQVPMEIQGKKVPVPVSMTFQRLELLDHALGMEKVIDRYHQNRNVADQLPEEDEAKEDLNKKSVPTPRAVLEFLYPLFETLDYIHRSNVVHRDIKEENMMITPPEGWNQEDLDDLLKRGELKFLDLGLARDNSQGQENPLTLAADDVILGTLRCLAPEALQYSKNTRNPSADIYSLGIFLYSLITGQRKKHPYERTLELQMNTGKPAAEHKQMKINFNYPIEVGSHIGSLQPGQPSVVSLEDPDIQRFLQQGVHEVEVQDKLAWQIVQLVIQMCDPDPAKRPTSGQLMEFIEDPMSLKTAAPQAKPRKPLLKRSSRLKQQVEENKNGGLIDRVKKLFGG